LIYYSAFVKDVNSVTCQFLTFYSNTVEGQNITTTPRWIGVNKIRAVLQETGGALDTIAKNSDTAFSNTSWTESEPPKFEKLLNDTYNVLSTKTLSNRNPAASKKVVSTITPTYISSYGGYTKDKTLLNLIYQEFNTKIKASITYIDSAKNQSKFVSRNVESIKNSINNIDTSMKPLSDAFTTLESTIITQWIDYVIFFLTFYFYINYFFIENNHFLRRYFFFKFYIFKLNKFTNKIKAINYQ